MKLLDSFVSLTQQAGQRVFSRRGTEQRALQHALALPLVVGPRTIAATISTLGRQLQDWSADYKLFSRSRWPVERLFTPVAEDLIGLYPNGPLPLALDDTRLPKTGKKIPHVGWGRDPMSPPFHVNLMFGLRFVQVSALYPLYQQGDYSARALPLRFSEVPTTKKPGKRSTEEEKKAYREWVKRHNLSTEALQEVCSLRTQFDLLGAQHRPLMLAVDGSFCNRTFFRDPLDRIELIARARKDARLCWPAAPGGRLKYDPNRFTPEQVRQDDTIAWKKTKIYYAGKWRKIRYKQLNGVLWKRGSGQRRVRLIVIAPQPYRLPGKARSYFRDPAYLLCTDLQSSARKLIQIYSDRWQIEVNHRDEKSIFGVGQAQVRSALSVPRHPAFAVAVYSLLQLAALRCYGPGRADDFGPLPKWRKNAKRASLLDILRLLSKQINETSVSICDMVKHVQNGLCDLPKPA
jgi:hypothetical protein